MIRQISNLFFTASFAFLVASQTSNAFEWSFKSKPEKKRTYLYVVGSSTISPFMATVASEFSREQNLKNHSTEMPLVESTGTRDGFKFFCEGVGEKYPDFVNASRPIEPSEIAECNKNGVKEIVAIKIGYDGIVIGNLIGSQKIKLTKEHIFLALAEKVYDQETKKLVKNPYQTWNQIDANLPKSEIIFYAPPLTSGTRDVFVDLLMEEVCFAKKEFVDAYKTYESRKEQCAKMRDDRRFIESGENDDLIIKALKNNPKAFGIFGFNFLVANQTTIQPAKIDDVLPSFATISSKQYKLSRPLFVYFKKEHLNLMPEMSEFIKQIVSAETIGKKGYLLHSGLVALTDSELKEVRKSTLSQLKKL